MAAVLRRKSNSSRRRIAAVSFLSNISLDGTYKDTKLTLLSGNNFIQKKTEPIPCLDDSIAEEPDVFDKCSTNPQVKRSDLDITKSRFKKAKNTDAHSLSSDSDCVVTPTRLGVDDSNKSLRERSDGKKEGHSRKRTTSGNRPLSSFGDGLDPFISLGIERNVGQETSFGYLLVPTNQNDDSREKCHNTIDDSFESNSSSLNKGKRLQITRRLSCDQETDPLYVPGSTPLDESVINQTSSASSSYQPNWLDDPDLVSGKHRTQQSFSSYMTSVIDNFKPSDLKKEINDKFREKFPHIELTLTKLRSLKREMRKIGKMENMDLITVAQAYVYFEKLVLKGVINKQNRKLCAGASLILAAKLNDVKGDAIRGLWERTENIFRLNRKEMVQTEFAVLVALEFGMHIPYSEIAPHYKRCKYCKLNVNNNTLRAKYEPKVIIAIDNGDLKCENVSEPWKLYAKKQYNEKVKTNSYEINLQAEPFDNDIRNPKLDWFLPHYKRLGYEERLPWISTTQDMLSQVLTFKETPNPNKKFLGYYTYHDELEYLKKDKHPCPSQFAVDEYISTMQHSYKPQRGYITERLAIAETPFFENRRFKIENHKESRNKFWDDDHSEEIRLLHDYKPNRQLSYNFMTGCMSDGNPIPKNLYTII